MQSLKAYDFGSPKWGQPQSTRGESRVIRPHIVVFFDSYNIIYVLFLF